MPAGDRTGPEGRGPMTGRGLGYCAGYDSPGYTKGVPRGGRGLRRGFGRDLGRGRGRRNRRFQPRDYYYRDPYYEPLPPRYPERPHPEYYRERSPRPSKEEEKAYLENLIKNLEEEMKAVKERLNEISE